MDWWEVQTSPWILYICICVCVKLPFVKATHRLCMEIIDFSLKGQILKYLAISCHDLGSLLSKDSETTLWVNMDFMYMWILYVWAYMISVVCLWGVCDGHGCCLYSIHYVNIHAQMCTSVFMDMWMCECVRNEVHLQYACGYIYKWTHLCFFIHVTHVWLMYSTLTIS